MRVKETLSRVPLPARVRLLFERITLSRTTAFYFFFSVIHCIFQVVFQVQAFTINLNAANLLASITMQGNATPASGFTVLGSDLRLCTQIPSTMSTSSCEVIWNGTAIHNNKMMVKVPSESPAIAVDTYSISSESVASTASAPQPNSTTVTSHSSTEKSSTTETTTHTTATISKPTSTTSSSTNEFYQSSTVGPNVHSVTATVSMSPAPTPTTKSKEQGYDHAKRAAIQTVDVDGTVSVIINGLGWNQQPAVLDRQCLLALNWPVQVLRNTKREDITFIAFQFWVLGMSLVALLNESVPHTVASLLTHMVATGWAGLQLYNTAEFHDEFGRLATNGACDPINLIPSYWHDRAAAEIPSLVLNAVGLIVSAILSWRLAKLYGWQTFKRVGASITISRVYKVVLTLSIAIQLSLFFMVSAIALWIDQLWNGAIGKLATSPLYAPMLIITLVLMIPWLATGWFAVRKELKIPMLVFLVLSFGYLVGWGAMFDSLSFRWTFVQWRFFAFITTSSVVLTFSCFVLGIIGRVNFGKGLVRNLNAQETLPDDGFTYLSEGTDVEKAHFLTSQWPIPTFSVAFGSDIPPPPVPPKAARQASINSTTSGDTDSRTSPSKSSFASLDRKGSQRSEQSVGSEDHQRSTSNGHSKRWMIE